MSVYKRLQELGIALPPPPPLGGLYTPYKRVGNLVYTAGQGPIVDGNPVMTGKLGAELTIEQGQEAARICAVNILSIMHKYLGDLNKITNVVKLLAFVASTPQFFDQPQVINDGSKLFLDVFGENGRHARSAIGTNVLPGNIPVEIEAIFEVKD